MSEPAIVSSKFSEALVVAASLHREQRRKGPSRAPYIGHLLTVSAIVLEFGGTENQAIAALLHDAVEDQGGAPTRDLIRRLFGDEVTAIVDACTDTDGEPKPPWRERKEAFLRGLASASDAALMVILADKLHNVQSTVRDLRNSGPQTWERFRGGKDGTLWYYRSIHEQARPAGPKTEALWRELGRALKELEAAA